MKKILVIDNYDSFTYNLVYYLNELTGTEVDVRRNDTICLEEAGRYDKILISPGPGIPVEAGICLDLIRYYSPYKSILGICLGHQAIAEAFGGRIVNTGEVHHGVSGTVRMTGDDEPLFTGLPDSIQAGRYHSWIVSREYLPSCLTVTCTDDKGTIMGLNHKSFDVRGLQFHPESVLTHYGHNIISNWLKL